MFGKDVKFIKLVDAIDQRYKLYEALMSGSEPHPPGLELICQEFRNLKVKAWSIETGGNAAELIRELHNTDEIKERLTK